jgi:hypothetical protein
MTPAAEARQKLRDGGHGRRVVDVVEDHQPAQMVFQPAERGGDFHRVLARVFFRQIENVRPGERERSDPAAAWLLPPPLTRPRFARPSSPARAEGAPRRVRLLAARTNASFTMIGEFPICRDMANTH